MPTEKQLEIYSTNIKPSLVSLIERLKQDIELNPKDFTESEDDDAAPYIKITIACNADLKDWQFQTGDNSYSGACYHRKHWGIIDVFQDSDAALVADYLISDMLDMLMQSNDANKIIETDEIAQD